MWWKKPFLDQKTYIFMLTYHKNEDPENYYIAKFVYK